MKPANLLFLSGCRLQDSPAPSWCLCSRLTLHPSPTHLQAEPDLQFSREENRHNLLPFWRFLKDIPPPSLSREEAVCPLTCSPGPVLPGAVIEGGQSSCYPLLFHHPAPSSLLIFELRTLASAHNPPFIPIFATVLEEEDSSPLPSYFNGLAPHSSGGGWGGQRWEEPHSLWVPLTNPTNSHSESWQIHIHQPPKDSVLEAGGSGAGSGHMNSSAVLCFWPSSQGSIREHTASAAAPHLHHNP